MMEVATFSSNLWHYQHHDNNKNAAFDSSPPDEIMFDIFSRLRIRELFRCQLVCKDWYKNWNNFNDVPVQHY
ncbi:hypothetical protein FRX31_027227 [Thalictrum thalictroides]|uniref:F-box domain-containing protein n=1 Tax=Thalictrum thalictroides TaxID=46969 RepID=A0A7J6VEJ6_THATH|nr:hypothetical protein FRX31_027227 [Thalictrum thalictroides]